MATPITASSPVAARVRAGGVREVTLLAYPIVLTQMSQTVMHVVDSIFVGRLGAAELGALGFAGIWLWTVMSVFSGTATGVQTFVSQAHGAGDEKSCGAWAWQGLYAVVPPLTLALFAFVAVAEPLWRRSARRPRSASTRSPTRACVRSASRGSASGWCSPRSSAASATRAPRSSRRSSRTR